MKRALLPFGISFLATVALIPSATAQSPAAPVQAKREPIYDIKADAEKDIQKALVEAKKSKKNVLLQFGANWCGWCYKLHDLFAADQQIASTLKKNYIVVLVDVDKDHNSVTSKKYGEPGNKFGLPAIVVLDPAGKVLTVQDTGKLEEGPKHDPKKVLEFLKAWVPKA